MLQNYKEIMAKAFGLASAALIIGGGALFARVIVNWTSDVFFPEEVVVEVPNVPPIEIPPSATGGVLENLTELRLLDESYVVPENPFGEYYKNAPRIMYVGEFKSAEIQIEGNLIGNGGRMLLFNFGRETGIYKGARKNSNLIDVQRTKELGGFFSEGNSLFATINLLSDSLGSSSFNLEYCNGVCTFKFIKNPTSVEAAPVLAVPITEQGKFGGAEIRAMNIYYECAEGKECEVSICREEKVYGCVLTKYGKAVADDWLRRYLSTQ